MSLLHNSSNVLFATFQHDPLIWWTAVSSQTRTLLMSRTRIVTRRFWFGWLWNPRRFTTFGFGSIVISFRWAIKVVEAKSKHPRQRESANWDEEHMTWSSNFFIVIELTHETCHMRIHPLLQQQLKQGMPPEGIYSSWTYSHSDSNCFSHHSHRFLLRERRWRRRSLSLPFSWWVLVDCTNYY